MGWIKTKLMKARATKIKFESAFIFFAIFFFGTVRDGKAVTDYYVSPSGSNTNAGTTAGAAFKTISKAVTMVAAGGTVHVAAGTYSENITTTANGTASARIRYVSDTHWGAKIIGSGTEAMWTNNGSYTDIVGFDITGSGRLGIVNMGSYTLMSGNHVHNLAVSGGCTGSGGAGIVDANYSGSDCDIIGNVVHDIGVPGACNGVQGIYHSNLRGHIMNNIVYRASAFGIHLWHAATDVVIANNTVFANGSSGMGGGIVIGDGDSPGGIVMNNTKIINNIVFNNPASSITEYCYSGVNCIGSGNIVSNNVVYGNGSGISLKVGSAVGTITTDPQFVNYQADGTGNYHLKSTSPAIDKGISTNAPSTDLDGNARPQGAGYDIGAYEYMLTTGIENSSLDETLLVIYPNPFQTNFNIKISAEIILKDAVIKMYDVCGREVKAVFINDHQTIVDRAELQNGIYFYQVINNNESVAKGKLVIQ